MDVEVSVSNLRKLCRICLNTGEIHLWKDKIKIPKLLVAFGKSQELLLGPDGEDEFEETTTVQEMMLIFNEWNHSILDLRAEMQLICSHCLDQLLDCYLYLRKLVKANVKVKELFKEAIKVETEINENMMSGADNTEYLDEYYNAEIANQQPGNSSTTDTTQQFEKVEANELEGDSEHTIIDCKSSDMELSNEMLATNCNEPNEVILNESTLSESSDCELIDTTVTIKKDNRIACRTKNSADQHGQRKRNHSNHSLENASLVISQFLPKTKQVAIETAAPSDANINSQSPNQFRTVDYGAVEVKGAEIYQMADNESEMIPSPEPDDRKPVYVCQYCPQAFSARDYLMTHLRKSHVCKFCTKAFLKNVDLFHHIKQVHHQHKCEICGKILSSYSNLRGHIKRMHGLNLPTQSVLLGVHHQSTYDEENEGISEEHRDEEEAEAEEPTEPINEQN